ncbi:hypothetical protein GJ744_005735 [Endocarpon pusillum]|uniref:Uncharacterized protein n=1 Tax=Endocarpon pusillum TaxID=364733 RepID=A0A8H7ATK8_9EURO|nr:hypothetical protein GJ744_005735 [Endocarpon pusillum]
MAQPPPEVAAYQLSHLYEDDSQKLGAFYIGDDFAFLIGATIAQGTFIVLMIYAFRAGLGKHWLALTEDQKLLFAKESGAAASRLAAAPG